MPWLQAHLTVTAAQTELVELLFEQLGAVSVTLGDAADEPMLEPAPGETPVWSSTQVSGLFSGDTDADDLHSQLCQALQTDISRHLRLERVEDQDWERSWLQYFKPLKFGQRLWICPSGHQVDQADAVVIDLDPGLAFGTGTHPTTALCLRWLDSMDVQGRTVIDYGCGSGILAIAALKLGASHAIGIDHDPQAIIASRENARRNQVENKLELHLAGEFDAPPADLVLANILANVLIDLQPKLCALVAPGGHLVLSGLLTRQAESVSQKYAEVLRVDAPTELDGWGLLHARREA